ncbi:MAG: poly-gamma-glutamate synthase PgsB, partial [Lachnospiraceae bacterium]|nr:poly-gamma-glutamate synthase PgsB [Lachnospiraceae bacterium]
MSVIIILSVCWLLWLIGETVQARRDRRRLFHVVHVNGIRGKSSTARLIAAGLAAGGIPVVCKTTGTDPAVIGVDGKEKPLRRLGPSNIREQLRILHRAASQGAQVLVVECMALQPELQEVSQHRMLQADIGVITNVRMDHMDVMGETLGEIAESLASTVPREGILFTAETQTVGPLRRRAEALGTRFVQAVPTGEEPEELSFPENIALALAVCESLGVARETALEGMRRYRPEPYGLSVWRVGAALFVNALSANDAQSTSMIWERAIERFGAGYPERVLLLNNRVDRGSRTEAMREMAVLLAPDEIWLMGASQGYLSRRLRRELPAAKIRGWRGLTERTALPGAG